VYSLAWLVIVGVLGAVLGAWLGNLIARVRSKSAARIQELEAQLESARGEISSYRREVFDQFAATARKFKSLDESYHDLHRQLAASARQLCGEAAGPLLAAPERADALMADRGKERAAAPPADDEPVAAQEPAAAAPDETVADDADDGVPILVAEADDATSVNGGSVDTAQSPAAAQDESAADEPAPKRLGDAA